MDSQDAKGDHRTTHSTSRGTSGDGFDPTETIDLMKAAKGGDQEALERFYLRCTARLRQIARRRMGPRARAEHESVDIAQFTFSNRDIEAVVLAAHENPDVTVRMAMNHEQQNFDSVAKRLSDAGVDVHFVQGKDLGSRIGLQHAKFMRVDEDTLLIGSNNWSSTGTSINSENTMVITGAEGMVSLEASLAAAVRAGRLDRATAERHCYHRDELDQLLR